MLNNKGFAISIVLYSMSAIIILILILILGIYATNIHNTEDTAEKIKEQVSSIGIE